MTSTPALMTAPQAAPELHGLQDMLRVAQAHLVRAEAHLQALRNELQAMEEALCVHPAWLAGVRGRHLLYVGGRPRNNRVLRAWVEAAGGQFTVYAGRVDDDDHPTGLAVVLAGVDQVLCPLDLIDADSLAALRVLCARHGVPWRALRSASIASFVAGVLLRADDGLMSRRGAWGGCRK